MSPTTLPRTRAVGAYFAWNGLMLLSFHGLPGNPAAMGAWWPVTALVIGSMIVIQPEHRWKVFLAFYATSYVMCLFIGEYQTVALLFTTGSVIECLVGYQLLTKWAGEDALNGSDRGLLRFLATVAIICIINAAVNVVVFYGLDMPRAGVASLAITLVRAVGTLQTLPFLMDGTSTRPCSTTEFVILVTATIATTLLLLVPTSTPTFALLFVPVIMWMSLRSSYVQMVLLTVIFGLIITTMLIIPVGYFERLATQMHVDTYDMLIMTSSYLLVILSAAIPMSATVSMLRRTSKVATDQHNRLQRVLESASGMMIMTMEPGGHITRFSAGATQILGYSEKEVLAGQAPMLSRADVAEMMNRNGLTRAEGYGKLAQRAVSYNPNEPVRRVLALTAKDGSRKMLATTTTAVRDEDGQVIEFLTTGDDVTERVATEKALRKALRTEQQASERLAHIDQLKTELVSTVSHELRTPIASIIGYTELLLDSAPGELNREQVAMMDSVDRSSRRLLRLVDDLLTVSRIEDTSISLSLTRFDVRSLLIAVEDSVEAIFRRDEVTLRIGSVDPRLEIEADFDSLFRVLSNLLSNAAKFSRGGGGVVEVNVTADSDQLYLEVSDNGIGISQDDLPQLFQRFFRGHDAYAQQVPGTGLGLYIAATIVRQHGGTIEVDSALGKGTTFNVRLPLRQRVHDQPQQHAAR